MPSISSVQITFHENLAPKRHAMPPGGFRLAVVNGFTLTAALSARARLQDHFLGCPTRSVDIAGRMPWIQHAKGRAGLVLCAGAEIADRWTRLENFRARHGRLDFPAWDLLRHRLMRD
jgi:hypothetical protein